ncbi:MAG: NADPH-dependent F420 reductase [Candidatus Sericytochromatia bacterium]
MKVTIVGYGNMGSGLAKRIAAAEHQVVLTGRNLDKAQAVATESGGGIRVLPAAEAASDADIIIAATPYAGQVEALRELGDLDGKTVVDISNPVKPDNSGLEVGTSTSAAEEIAKALPGARVIKAFNTIFAPIFSEDPDFGHGTKAQVMYAGDDRTSKLKVQHLIESMGFLPVDAGPLSNARNLEPIGMQNIWFGFTAKQGTGIVPIWLHRHY